MSDEATKTPTKERDPKSEFFHVIDQETAEEAYAEKLTELLSEG